MSYKLFQRRSGDHSPSTQFAATIVALPSTEEVSPSTWGPSMSSLPSLPAAEASANDSAPPSTGPDLITDIGGLPSEIPDPSDTPTLSHIGRYALKRQLGAGGLGAVFEAWDPLLSRAVAVKTLQFDVDAQSRLSLDGLFLNEARAAAGLNHKYIVTIHDAGLSPHGVYIAMERLYGRDLQQALAEGWRPTLDQAVVLVRRVADALAYAHARGVIHCDIKPANIFLQRRDKPKVLDFGIARIVHGAALPALEGAVAGSPRYRAPEQLSGAPLDARTDLYSLGVVMFELLTGQRAIEGETLAEINQSVTLAGPRLAHDVNAEVPQDLSAMVRKLMARDPSERYTCAGEFVMELRRWMQQRERLALASLAARPSASANRRPGATRWLLGGAVALAAASALLAALLGQREPSAARAVPPPAPVARAAPAPETLAAPVATADPAAPAAPVAEATAALPIAPAALTPATPTTTAATTAAAAQPTPPAAGTSPSGDITLMQAARSATAVTQRATPAGRSRVPGPRALPAGEATAPAAALASGVLHIAVSPWGQIEVNGHAAGTTPPLTQLTLPEGRHQITLRNADFVPHTVQVQISADKPMTLKHRFGS